MKKYLVLGVTVFFFILLVRGCGNSIATGDTVVAEQGVQSLYGNLSNWNWQESETCQPTVGESFVVDDISYYGDDSANSVVIHVTSVNATEVQDGLFTRIDGCSGWTHPGDIRHWKRN